MAHDRRPASEADATDAAASGLRGSEHRFSTTTRSAWPDRRGQGLPVDGASRPGQSATVLHRGPPPPRRRARTRPRCEAIAELFKAHCHLAASIDTPSAPPSR